MSTVRSVRYVHEIFSSASADFPLQNFAKYYDAIGDRISVVFVHRHRILGTQNGPVFMGPGPLTRKLFQPFHRPRNDWIQSIRRGKTFIHFVRLGLWP